MTAPLAPIDRAVALLFRAIVATKAGDHMAVAVARGELVAIAGTIEDFEAQLTTAAVDQLVTRAIEIESRRHVGNSRRLAETEPWGSA